MRKKQTQSFNHPMVKVKDIIVNNMNIGYDGFNHPMVKVKGLLAVYLLEKSQVSTTLW